MPSCIFCNPPTGRLKEVQIAADNPSVSEPDHFAANHCRAKRFSRVSCGRRVCLKMPLPGIASKADLMHTPCRESPATHTSQIKYDQLPSSHLHSPLRSPDNEPLSPAFILASLRCLLFKSNNAQMVLNSDGVAVPRPFVESRKKIEQKRSKETKEECRVSCV